MRQQKTLHGHRSLGERIRWLRKREGLSLQQFGQRVGFDRSYLSRLENGKADNPSEDFLGRVCLAFKIGYDWLSTGQGVIDDPKGLGLPVTYTPWGRQLEEDTEMTSAISLFVDLMSSDQLMACVNAVVQHPAMSEKAKLFWIKTLGIHAVTKRALEQASPRKS